MFGVQQGSRCWEGAAALVLYWQGSRGLGRQTAAYFDTELWSKEIIMTLSAKCQSFCLSLF